MHLWIITAFAAFFVKGLCGFANTLVFTTILSFGNSNVNISPVELVIGFPANFLLAFRERKSIKWSLCLPLAALVIAGSIPGALFLRNSDTGAIKTIFGVLIIFIGLEMLLREITKTKMKQSKIALAIIGVLSGVLCGLYGVGALLGAYMSKVTDNSSAFKANLCFVFLVDNIFRIVLYSVWGILNFEMLKQALILLPFVLVGLSLGIVSSRFISEKIAKIMLVVLLVFSGTALVFTGI